MGASLLKDQCGVIWIGHTRGHEQRDEFAKVSGLPREYRPVLDGIPPRHWLYSDYAGERLMLARTTAPGASSAPGGSEQLDR